MKGYLAQRSPGSWRLVVDVGVDPITGKRRQVTRTVRGGKREAQRELARLITQAGAGELTVTTFTVDELVARWLAHHGRNLAPKTLEDYEGIIRRHVTPHPIAQRRLTKLRVADLDEHYDLLGDAGVGAETVRKVHNILGAALAQAVRWRWIPTNPARDATKPKVAKPRARAPKPTIVADLLAAAELGDPGFAAYVYLSCVLGARRGEVCALRWRDVDLEHGTALIAANIVAVKGRLIEKDSTKTDDDRPVALGPAAVRCLADHRRRTAERLLACGVALDDDTYVFPSAFDGTRPARPDGMTHRFIKLRRTLVAATGDQAYERVRLYDLRHHAATQLAAAGVDARTLMGRFGWRNLKTAQRYIDFVAENDRAAAERIERILRGAG